MPSTETTMTDVLLSVNGYDEIAIASYFNAELTELQDKPLRAIRAMVFIAERRGGANDKDAYKAAMTLTQAEAAAYFPDDPTDTDEHPDEPESEVGKDGAPSH